jgi:hypothetical protein
VTLHEIVEELLQCENLSPLLFVKERIASRPDFGHPFLGYGSRLINGHLTISADRRLASPAVGGTILEHERLPAVGRYPAKEAS